MTQLFSPQRIEATKAMRMKRVQELVNFISECSEREETVDISHASFVTALNIISNILFSVSLGSYDSKNSSVFHELMTGVMEAIGNPDLANFFPFLRFFDLQGNSKKMKDYSERLFQVFRGFYDDRIVENSSRTDEKDVSSNDFVDVLIDLHQGDQSEININEIEHLLLVSPSLLHTMILYICSRIYEYMMICACMHVSGSVYSGHGYNLYYRGMGNGGITSKPKNDDKSSRRDQSCDRPKRCHSRV